MPNYPGEMGAAQGFGAAQAATKPALLTLIGNRVDDLTKQAASMNEDLRAQIDRVFGGDQQINSPASPLNTPRGESMSDQLQASLATLDSVMNQLRRQINRLGGL